MPRPAVRLEYRKEMCLYGIWTPSNDRTAAKDMAELSSSCHRITGTQDGAILPYFVLSRNYGVGSGSFEWFIASLARSETLQALILPENQYAVVAVRPGIWFLRGLAMGKAARFLYKMAAT